MEARAGEHRWNIETVGEVETREKCHYLLLTHTRPAHQEWHPQSALPSSSCLESLMSIPNSWKWPTDTPNAQSESGIPSTEAPSGIVCLCKVEIRRKSAFVEHLISEEPLVLMKVYYIRSFQIIWMYRLLCWWQWYYWRLSHTLGCIKFLTGIKSQRTLLI